MSNQTQTTKVRRQVAETCAEQIIHLLDVGHVNDINHYIEGALESVENDYKAKLATLEAERDAGKRDIEFLQREVKKREYDRGALVERCEALSAEVQKLREACKNGLALLTALVADDEHQSLDRDMIFDQMTAALNSNAGEKGAQ